MRILLTGSSGRVGRAIYSALAGTHVVVGIDRSPFSTTAVIGDFTESERLARLMEGIDAVIHAAALHAPHVGAVAEAEFWRVNVEGSRQVARAAIAAGVTRLVFTSTTALYGDAIVPGGCVFLDETSRPLPRSIYHRTKLAAEEALAADAGVALDIRVLRMARCFPEQADVMAAYRLHRGIDLRDVADAHVAALTNAGAPFQCHVISGETPFLEEDRAGLAEDAPAVFRLRAPDLCAEFARRGWALPARVDRVYRSLSARAALGWRPRFTFDEVLLQLERRSLEVLPPRV